MDYTNKYIDIKKDNNVKLTTNERGEISYFSITQVADLLKEDDSKIRYYTNIFNDILQIEIEDKQLKYKNTDINKLEFLINLKNKGMTIKEIQQYCKEISLSDEDIQEINKKNILSIDDLIGTIVDAENKNFDKLNNQVTEKIKEDNLKSNEEMRTTIESEQNKFIEKLEKANKEYAEDIKKSLIEEQKKCIDEFKTQLRNDFREINREVLNELAEEMKKENYSVMQAFKDELKKDIKGYIQDEFKNNKDELNGVKDEVINRAEEIIVAKIEEQEKTLKDKLNASIENFNMQGDKRDKNLLNEIKKFEEIMKQAYYIQEEVEKQRGKMGLFQKLFGI